MQKLLTVTLLVSTLCLHKTKTKSVATTKYEDYFNVDGFKDDHRLKKPTGKLNTVEVWTKSVIRKKRQMEEIKEESLKVEENDELSRLPFNMESLKKETSDLANTKINEIPKKVMTDIGLSPMVKDFLDTPLIKIPLEREELKVLGANLPLIVNNPDNLKPGVLPPKNEGVIIMNGELPPLPEDKIKVLTQEETEEGRKHQILINEPTQDDPVKIELGIHPDEAELEHKKPFVGPEGGPDIDDKLSVIAPLENKLSIVPPPEGQHPIFDPPPEYPPIPIIPPEEVPQGVVVPIEQAVHGPVLKVEEPFVPPPPPPPLPPLPPPPPVLVEPIKVEVPIPEEPVIKPPEINTPFAKGTRWALYFGNMFLSTLSQVLVGAQTALAQFAKFAAP